MIWFVSVEFLADNRRPTAGSQPKLVCSSASIPFHHFSFSTISISKYRLKGDRRKKNQSTSSLETGLIVLRLLLLATNAWPIHPAYCHPPHTVKQQLSLITFRSTRQCASVKVGRIKSWMMLFFASAYNPKMEIFFPPRGLLIGRNGNRLLLGNNKWAG